MIKQLSRIFKGILVLTTFILVFGQSIKVLAQTTNGLDIFYITSPLANQSVKGSISVSWKMYDDAQESISYTAKVFDRETCETTNYGSITANNNGLSSKVTDNVLIWDTRSTDTTANLSDGFYCLQICLALVDNNIPYSSCNGREILIVNNNRSPIISSLPPSDNEILENESWSYQVNASDPDSQSLSYRLLVKPTFLDINPTTGLISTNSNSKALAVNVYRAEYRVVVEVKDTFNSITTQEFNIVVYKPLPQPPVNNGGGNDGSSDDLDDSEKNEASIINISSPKSNSNLSGKDNLIKWNINDSDGISSIDIEYSTDEIDWINITTIKDSDTQSIGEYTWDVSKLSDGKYFLRFKVSDNENSVTEEIISNINIKNTEDITSLPIIYELKPENSSEITEIRPEISAKFVASTGNSINTESFKISLDDIDILDKCSLTTEGFICKLSSDLDLGKHKVKASISDTSEKTTEQEWFFDIVETHSNNNVDEGNVVNILGRDIPVNTLITLLLICLLAILLLLIPWAIFLFIQNRRKKKTKVDINIDNRLTQPLPALGETPSADDIQKVFMPETQSVPVPEVKVETEVNEPKKLEDNQNVDISSFEEFLKQYPDLNSLNTPSTPETTDNTDINIHEPPLKPVVENVTSEEPKDINITQNISIPSEVKVEEPKDDTAKEDLKTNSENIPEITNTVEQPVTPVNDAEFVEPEITDSPEKVEESKEVIKEDNSTNTPEIPSNTVTPIVPDINIVNNISYPDTGSSEVTSSDDSKVESQPVFSESNTTPNLSDTIKSETPEVTPQVSETLDKVDIPTVETLVSDVIEKPLESNIPNTNQEDINTQPQIEDTTPITFESKIVEPVTTPEDDKVLTNEVEDNTESSEVNLKGNDIDKKTLYSPVQFETVKPNSGEYTGYGDTIVEDKDKPVNTSSWVEFYEQQQKLKDQDNQSGEDDNRGGDSPKEKGE